MNATRPDRFGAQLAGAFCLNLLLFSMLTGCSGDTGVVIDEPTVDSCGFAIAVFPDGCDDCHGAPPQADGHPQNDRCYRCHGQVVDGELAFIQPDLHMNGEIDVAVGCSSCHGWNFGTAPPQNLVGECDNNEYGVGAHRAMRFASTPVHRVSCANCHTVPGSTWDEGHIDGDGVVEVTFGYLATADGATPTYDAESLTCSGVYCHGATLIGGDHKSPSFSDRSGVAGQCGACHRLADPQGNTDVDCRPCHASTVDEDGSISARGAHINGRIDF